MLGWKLTSPFIHLERSSFHVMQIAFSVSLSRCLTNVSHFICVVSRGLKKAMVTLQSERIQHRAVLRTDETVASHFENMIRRVAV